MSYDETTKMHVIVNNRQWKRALVQILEFLPHLGPLILSYCDPVITWKISWWQDDTQDINYINWKLRHKSFDTVQAMKKFQVLRFIEYPENISFVSEFDCQVSDQTVDSYILVVDQ